MEYVIMLDRSAGNESVGEAWTETKVFPETATLADVEEWIRARTHSFRSVPEEPTLFAANVKIAVSQ